MADTRRGPAGPHAGEVPDADARGAAFGLGHLLAWLGQGEGAPPQPGRGAAGTESRPGAGDAIPAADGPFSAVTMSSLPSGQPPMRPGGLFVAIATGRRDGHDFVPDAFANGARAALVARVPGGLQEAVAHGRIRALDFRAGAGGRQVGPPAGVSPGQGGLSAGSLVAPALPGPEQPLPGGGLLLLVDDPLRTLQGCAAWWRRRHQASVLAVAGAVGKTTTKELLANILQRRYRTLRTPGNFNNELGLPITLLGLTAEHQVVALEIGISEIGEMASFAAIAGADVAVMTRIVPEHMHQLEDLDTVEREEGRLVEALPPGGTAVLNGDDPRVARMAERTVARVVRFGEGVTADVRASGVELLGLQGVVFDLHSAGPAGEETRRVHLPLVGRHFVTAALAAAAAAIAAGCTWEDVLEGLRRPPEAQRLAPRSLPGDVTLLDDSYNASPDSTRAALDVLASLGGRRIVLLGDMLELGAYAPVAHREVGEHVPGRADVLVTVGELGREIARAARTASAGPLGVHECASTADAISLLRELLRRGDTLLVKGSHGMHLETVVQALEAGGPGPGVEPAHGGGYPGIVPGNEADRVAPR